MALPDLGIERLEAKVDSGARTSALHAVKLQPVERDGVSLISFSVPLTRHHKTLHCVAPIVDQRSVKNTGGEWSERFIIKTSLVLGGRRWLIEVSLADREQMEYDLILGRTAIRGKRILIDPQRSFLAEPPQLASDASPAK